MKDKDFSNASSNKKREYYEIVRLSQITKGAAVTTKTINKNSGTTHTKQANNKVNKTCIINHKEAATTKQNLPSSITTVNKEEREETAKFDDRIRKTLTKQKQEVKNAHEANGLATERMTERKKQQSATTCSNRIPAGPVLAQAVKRRGNWRGRHEVPCAHHHPWSGRRWEIRWVCRLFLWTLYAWSFTSRVPDQDGIS